jgi:hypothetical protein
MKNVGGMSGYVTVEIQWDDSCGRHEWLSYCGDSVG